MTDRELLELAAKASGLTMLDTLPNMPFWANAHEGLMGPWNPLEDDGDALRLAVKLNIHLSPYGGETGMTAWVIREVAESFDEDYGGDPCAASRRAIVRAAADIGRLMP